MSELETIQFVPGANGYEPERSALRGLQEGDIDHQAYLKRLDEINDTWRIIRDPRTGHRFEAALVNAEYMDKELVLFPSTEYSSLTQNIGNAIELAAQGVEKPHTARLYVAFHGNGGSQGLTLPDRLHFMRTGRLTRGGLDGDTYQPLPSVMAMARAIEKNFAAPNHVSADVAGARLGLAVMAALDRDSVKDAHLNGPPGVSHQAHYIVASLSEDLADRMKRWHPETYRTGDIIKESRREAKAKLPKIYRGIGHDALFLSTYGRAPLNVPTNLFGLRHHDDLDQPARHALLQDLLAALGRQEAIISLQFNTEAPADIADCVRLGKMAMDRIPIHLRSDQRAVELLIGEGGTDAHTTEPAGRMAAERRALRSITTFMRAISRGRTDTLPAPAKLAEAEEAA